MTATVEAAQVIEAHPRDHRACGCGAWPDDYPTHLAEQLAAAGVLNQENP